MRLQELFKIAQQQAGNAPEGGVPDKREAFVLHGRRLSSTASRRQS